MIVREYVVTFRKREEKNKSKLSFKFTNIFTWQAALVL